MRLLVALALVLSFSLEAQATERPVPPWLATDAARRAIGLPGNRCNAGEFMIGTGDGTTICSPVVITCTVPGAVSGDCVPLQLGTVVTVTDGLTAGDCTVGGGSDVHLCIYTTEWEALQITSLTGAACTTLLAVAYNPSDASATTDYVSLVNKDATGASSFSATEADQDQLVLPKIMFVNSLRATVDVAPGAGNTRVFSIRDDAAGVLSCTISGTATNCSNVTASTAIAAGSKVDLRVTSTGAPNPSAAAEALVQACLTE